MNAQADLNRHWAYMSESTVSEVVARFIYGETEKKIIQNYHQILLNRSSAYNFMFKNDMMVL